MPFDNNTTTYIKNTYLFRVLQNFLLLISDFINNNKHYVLQYAPNIGKDEIIYFDFETTGLNPYHCKIIEYCFMIEDEDSSFISDIVNPEEKIDKKITEITGIHPEMFENKTNIDNHIMKIYNFINGNYKNSIFSVEKKYLVAHNAITFDSIFLERDLKNAQKTYKNITTSNFVYLDTVLLSRKLLPELRSHTLASLAKHYDVKTGTHRATSDVECLKTIYQKLLVDLSKQKKIPLTYFMDYPQEVYKYINY